MSLYGWTIIILFLGMVALVTAIAMMALSAAGLS